MGLGGYEPRGGHLLVDGIPPYRWILDPVTATVTDDVLTRD
jgi:hypothetical protein